MGRPTLTPAVEPLTVGAPPPAPPTQQQTPVFTESVTPVLPEPVAAEPRWRTFVRKEARLRQDQVDALGRLRRRVSASRSTREEVVTDNTLLRVAVDLLLSRADDLVGDTEEALRASLHLSEESQNR